MDVIAGGALVSIVGHHDVHLVVAVREQVRDDARGLGLVVGKGFGPERPVDPQPPELAAVSPVVHLGKRRQTPESADHILGGGRRSAANNKLAILPSGRNLMAI